MTEPTDAELKAMWQLHAADIGGIFYYARAVLAKWGTHAVAGEPVAIYHGRCTIDCGAHGHLDMELLKMIPAGARLYTTPQPTQAQAADSVLEDAAPSYTSLQLAEMVLSDCGCSTNNTSLLERVAKRIHVHVVAARKQGEKQ